MKTLKMLLMVLALGSVVGCANVLRAFVAGAQYAGQNGGRNTTPAVKTDTAATVRPATITAFFDHEVKSGGTTKQCVYNGLGNVYVRTVSTVDICPLNIQVPLH